MSETRALVGDLVVATIELVEGGGEPLRWCTLANEIATALRASRDPLPGELVGELARQCAPIVREVETGWPRAAWSRMCALRSGCERLRDIFEVHAPELVELVELWRAEQRMIKHARTLFAPAVVPGGTPAHHWWWFGSAPPGERTMRMNEQAWLRFGDGLNAEHLAEEFRRFVARGFVEQDGLILFRDRVPDQLPARTGRVNATYVEADLNVVAFGGAFADRPILTQRLGCARHLAYELRRRFPPCRIVVNVHPALDTLRFHRVRPGEDWATKDGAQTDLDHYTSAMLVFDTAV